MAEAEKVGLPAGIRRDGIGAGEKWGAWVRGQWEGVVNPRDMRPAARPGLRFARGGG